MFFFFLISSNSDKLRHNNQLQNSRIEIEVLLLDYEILDEHSDRANIYYLWYQINIIF